MKNFRISLKNVATMIASFAVSLMLFTGCEKDDPAPEPDNGIAEIGKTYVSTTANAEKVYTLKVSKNLTRSSAAATDTYVLLYVDKSGEVKTSTGTVTSSVGESLTLTPTGGTPFTVNVTANGITGISGNITFTDNSTATGGNLTPFADGEIEITGESVIVNGQEQLQLKDERVLGVPGMAINYVYKGVGMLAVKEGKTLIVLPGTTIRFTQTGGGIEIKSGATVKMLGEDKLRELDTAGNLSATPGTKSGHVTLKGSGSGDNKWQGLKVASTLANELNCVDIQNAGSESYNRSAAVYLDNGKLAMRNCVIDGSKSNGITLEDASESRGNTVQLTEFTGNTIKNSAKAPIYGYSYTGIYPLRSLGAGNSFSGNANEYIRIITDNADMHGNMNLHNVGEPYYFETSLVITSNRTLTIEAGTTILMGSDTYIRAKTDSWLVAEGSAQNRITIKGSANTAGYWSGIAVESVTAGTKFNYCDISGGGNGSGYGVGGIKGNISLLHDGHTGNAYADIRNTALTGSRNYGLYLNPYNDNTQSCNITTNNTAAVTFSNNTAGDIGLAISWDLVIHTWETLPAKYVTVVQ